jgi:hypothetical protein
MANYKPHPTHAMIQGQDRTLCGCVPASRVRFSIPDWLKAFLLVDCKICAMLIWDKHPAEGSGEVLEITK